MEGEMDLELRFVQATRGSVCDALQWMDFEEQAYQKVCAKRDAGFVRCGGVS